MLSDPTAAEKEILSAIPFQENRTILHTDTNLLPRHKNCWAGWNYRIPYESINRVAVTYDMNILQGLSASEEFCVTLNLPHAIDPRKVLKDIIYHHPVYTPKGLMMRERRGEINGINRTYYCGAYWGYGFHEDGVKSALDVCKRFGKTL